VTALQAILISLVQGLTELFPVSSLGHAVILPRLLGWPVDQKAPDFLPFLVVLHLGTALALFLYFWRDWKDFLLAALVNKSGAAHNKDRHLFFLVCVATVPAAVIGFALEHTLKGFFGAPTLAAVFLVINGFVLWSGERLKHAGRHTLEQLGWKTALIIGAFQALALIPGISRSGVTMVGGLIAGLRHEDSARFSFLLATPVIAGAGVLEVPKLLHSGSSIGGLAVLSGLIAGVTAYASVAVLMRYFKKHEFNALMPFAWYCWIAGGLSIILLR
jgi:undecaprenyl-diphosphatase